MNRNISMPTLGVYKRISKKNASILCFGPCHPAAHGVLRLILQLSGEVITKLDPHIGLLHRGTETLLTQKHYIKGIPYFDRLDYVSMLSQEHVYCLGIERLLGHKHVSAQINWLRIMFDELTRVLNHLLAVSCHALDIGSMSTLFWAFETREKIMYFYEAVSGARMHAAYYRPAQQFNITLTQKLLDEIILFTKEAYLTLNEMHNVLTYNALWKRRLINIGNLSYENCINYSLTGVLARSAGVKTDLRVAKYNSYSGYNFCNFKSFIGINGDSYDRYLIRMGEMGESLKLAALAAKKLKRYKILNKHAIPSLVNQNFYANKESPYTSMEDLISHFINWHTGFKVSTARTLAFIEAPKGLFGIMLNSGDSAKPIRCKIRSPSYFNLQALSKLSHGHTLADLAALIGTVDVVFGEVDR